MLDFVKRIVVVGVGGIGSWLLDPLCCFLAAERFEGQICVWDGDKYEPRNMLRQRCNGDTLNINKAVAQVSSLRISYPSLSLYGYEEFIVPGNIERAVKEDDLVFTCVDNHPARALIAVRSEELNNVCIISAGNELYDGNCHVTLRRNGKHMTAPLLDRHPEIASSKVGDRADAGCEELIKEGEKQLLFVNLSAATVALQCYFALHIHGSSNGRRRHSVVPNEVYFDIMALKADVVLANGAT